MSGFEHSHYHFVGIEKVFCAKILGELHTRKEEEKCIVVRVENGSRMSQSHFSFLLPPTPLLE